MSQSFSHLVHAHGQIFGFYRAHSYRMALHLLSLFFFFLIYQRDNGGEQTHTHHLPPFWFKSHFPNPLLPPPPTPLRHRSLLCSMVVERERAKRRILVSVERLREALCPRRSPIFQLHLAAFRRRHCCSWRWRGGGGEGQGEEPEQHCCLGLFGCGASGRGRWPTAARPRGPPCDKPGNVE